MSSYQGLNGGRQCLEYVYFKNVSVFFKTAETSTTGIIKSAGNQAKIYWTYKVYNWIEIAWWKLIFKYIF